MSPCSSCVLYVQRATAAPRARSEHLERDDVSHFLRRLATTGPRSSEERSGNMPVPANLAASARVFLLELRLRLRLLAPPASPPPPASRARLIAPGSWRPARAPSPPRCAARIASFSSASAPPRRRLLLARPLRHGGAPASISGLSSFASRPCSIASAMRRRISAFCAARSRSSAPYPRETCADVRARSLLHLRRERLGVPAATHVVRRGDASSHLRVLRRQIPLRLRLEIQRLPPRPRPSLLHLRRERLGVPAATRVLLDASTHLGVLRGEIALHLRLLRSLPRRDRRARILHLRGQRLRVPTRATRH